MARAIKKTPIRARAGARAAAKPEAKASEAAMASFATLRNQGLLMPAAGGQMLVERNFLISLMSPRIAAIPFDEEWYLARHPDVREAVDSGEVSSAHDHYLRSGYFEGRMPVYIAVQEKWYCEAYPDVADAVRRGVYKSAQAHFELCGYREGRIPYENFRLL